MRYSFASAQALNGAMRHTPMLAPNPRRVHFLRVITNPHNLGAIDIGSNAIRMVIAIHDSKGLRVLKKFRFPIRLGADVFRSGSISQKNLKLSAKTFLKFKEVSEKYQIKNIRAVGTSALREAKNQKEFLDLIQKKSKIKIEVIDGVLEAQLIHAAVRREIDLEQKNALLIDIGGGSVEITACQKGQMISTQSFPFGTVRTLEMMKSKQLTEEQLPLVMAEYLEPLSHFIHSQTNIPKYEFAVGTGGNLETLGKLKPLLLKSPSPTFLTYKELEKIAAILVQTSPRNRVDQLKLRPDRADVILPATWITLTLMRQAKIQKILIPHVGLKDGILWSMVQNKSYSIKSLGANK